MSRDSRITDRRQQVSAIHCRSTYVAECMRVRLNILKTAQGRKSKFYGVKEGYNEHLKIKLSKKMFCNFLDNDCNKMRNDMRKTAGFTQKWVTSRGHITLIPSECQKNK